MAGKLRPMMDPDAAEDLRQTVRDMAAMEQRPVTISEAVRRLVAWWRNDPRAAAGPVGGKAAGREG